MWRQLAKTCCATAAAGAQRPLPTAGRAALSTAATTSSSSSSSGASSPSPSPSSYKYLIPSELVADAPAPVERALSVDNMNAPERKQAEKQTRIQQFGLRPGDTGSTPVQVACLTVRIEHMKAHCAENRQDKAARRAYTALLTRRRNLLQYLRRKDFQAYQNTLKELKITGFT